MKVKLSLIVAVAFVFSLAMFAYGQEQQQQQNPPPAPQGPSSLDVQGIKSYLLGPGDVLDVRVFGQPELSSSVQVDSDGNLIKFGERMDGPT